MTNGTQQPNLAAARIIPDLTGKSWVEALQILDGIGFVEIKQRGSYRQWQHEDDSIVLISPDGRIVRQGPEFEPDKVGRHRRRYDQYHAVIPFEPGATTHDTGEELTP